MSAAVNDSSTVDPASSPPWVSAVLDDFVASLALERGRSPHTVRAYRGDIQRLLDRAVADGVRSVINEQVEMGVAVRMAVLEALAQHLPNS